MELIRILKEKCHAQHSVRKALRIYGASNDDVLTQPLATMPPEQVIKLVLNWLTLHAKNGHKTELRMPVPEEQKVYESGLLLKHNAIYVKYIHAAPELIAKTLHYWNLPVTYQTLTLKEIQSSVDRANAINLLRDCDALEHCVNDLATAQIRG